jgi:peptidyl-prolyl cis-trans isomerase A (cyclophilin A)
MARWLAVTALAIFSTATIAAEESNNDSTAAADKQPTATLVIKQGDTDLGTITIALNMAKAPLTAANFIQYARADHYDNTIFHRVISGFMIQGGGFNPELEPKDDELQPGIPNEWQNGLKNQRGTIAMARMGGNEMSATAQFFINVADNTSLDQKQRQDTAGYAVFGRVVDGMEVVQKIKSTPVESNPKYPAGEVVPVTPVVITDVKIENAPPPEELEKLIEKANTAFWQQRLREVGVEQASGDLTRSAEGALYETLKPGDGAKPTLNDGVRAHYTGWLLDGTKFDSSRDRGEPATFPLNGVVRGWQVMLSDMPVGERRVFILPPELGYGQRGAPPRIPPNAPLIFDVELLGVE